MKGRLTELRSTSRTVLFIHQKTKQGSKNAEKKNERKFDRVELVHNLDCIRTNEDNLALYNLCSNKRPKALQLKSKHFLYFVFLVFEN